MTSSSPPIPAGDGTSGSAIRSTTSMPARCRRRGCRSASRCCSTSSRSPRPTTRTCSGASSALRARGLARDAIPSSTGCSTYALAYFRDFIADSLRHRRADARWRRRRSRDLDARLAALPEDADAETIQTEVYEVGKAHPFESLRDWFKALYETLLGTSQGPRMGSFIALYGIANSRKLIAEALAA